MLARTWGDRGLETATPVPHVLAYRAWMEYQVGDFAEGEVSILKGGGPGSDSRKLDYKIHGHEIWDGFRLLSCNLLGRVVGRAGRSGGRARKINIAASK